MWTDQLFDLPDFHCSVSSVGMTSILHMDEIEDHPIEEPGAIRKEGSLEALSLSSKLSYLQNCFF